jgi:hypothetical protein
VITLREHPPYHRSQFGYPGRRRGIAKAQNVSSRQRCHRSTSVILMEIAVPHFVEEKQARFKVSIQEERPYCSSLTNRDAAFG